MAQIICEIGQNHLGKMTLARSLIKLAKENGADLAKFQLYDTDKLYEKGTDLYQQAKEAELSFEQTKMLFDYGQEIGIEVFFSVFDVEKVKWCEEIGVRRYKVAYSQNHNKELIKAIIDTDEEVLISTDVNGAFLNLGIRRFKELYCVPKYPAMIKDYDFNGWDGDIGSRNTFEVIHGLSDHTIGLDLAKIALARGAMIIEKHFCLSHYVGVDSPWSMTPEELKELKRWKSVCQEVL